MTIRKLFLTGLLLSGLVIQGNGQRNPARYGYFFYTIAKYVEWPPPHHTGELIIGILGDTDAIPHVEAMAEIMQINGRDILVKNFQEVNEMDGCHMLFVPAVRSADLEAVIREIGSSPTLVMTEKEGMAVKGSAINFVEVEGGKMGFEVNRAAVLKAGLKISPELKKFATEL